MTVALLPIIITGLAAIAAVVIVKLAVKNPNIQTDTEKSYFTEGLVLGLIAGAGIFALGMIPAYAIGIGMLAGMIIGMFIPKNAK